MTPKPRSWLPGHDIFISYARVDGDVYAARLGAELENQSYWCRLDQWNAQPGGLSGDLLRDLSRSRMLVVISTNGALASEAIETEIRRFSSPNGKS